MAARKSRDVRGPGGLTLPPGISGGANKGTAESGGGPSSSAPAGPPISRSI